MSIELAPVQFSDVVPSKRMHYKRMKAS